MMLFPRSLIALVTLQTALTWAADPMYDMGFGLGDVRPDDVLVREKRKAAGTAASDTQFVLTKLTGTDTPQIGDVLTYSIEIWLPNVGGGGMDLTVEILSSDPETGLVGLALCKPTVTYVGSALSSAALSTTSAPTMYPNPSFPQINDKAIFSFGSVVNTDVTTDTATNASLIKIEFCAALVDSGTNLSPVYLTAGADYASELYIWIGQDQLTPSYANRATTYAASATVISSPASTTIGAGDADGIVFEVAITHPFTPISFSTLDPDYKDFITVSYAGATFLPTGYYKSNNLDAAVSYLDELTPLNNYVSRETKYKALINMNGANDALTDAKNKVIVTTSFCVTPKAPVGDSFSIVTAATIGSSRIFLNVYNFTVGAAITRSATKLFTMEQVTLISSSITIPTGGSIVHLVKQRATATAPAWFNYLLTVKPPAGMTACGARMVFAGGNLACVPPLNGGAVIKNADGSMNIYLTVKNTFAFSEDPVQNEAWIEITVTHSSGMGGTLIFSDGGGNDVGKEINISNSTLGSGIPTGVIQQQPSASLLWYTSGQISYDAVITLPENYPVSNVLFEAMGQTTAAGINIRICRAELTFAGRGVGCLNPLMPPTATYSKSAAATLYNDKVSIQLGSFCGSKVTPQNSTHDRVLIFNVVADLPYQASTTAQAYKMSAGAHLTDTVLWVGNLDFNVQPLTTVPEYALTVFPTVVSFFSGGVAVGSSARVSFALKFPPNSIGNYAFILTSSDTNVAICQLKFIHIGKNFPCVDASPDGKFARDQSTRLTYERHDVLTPALGNKQAVLEFGILNNIGTFPLVSASQYDPSTIVVEAMILVSSTAVGTPTLTGLLAWTGLTTTSAQNVVTLALNGTAPAGATASAFSITAADRDQKVVAGYALGIPKEISIDIAPLVTNGSIFLDKMGVIVRNPTPDTAPFNICCAAVSFAGKNYPCLNHTGLGYTTTNVTTAAGAIIVNSVLLNLGGLCYEPLSTANGSEKLTVTAFINVDRYTGTFAGSISVEAEIAINAVPSGQKSTLTLAKTSTALVPDSVSGSVDLLLFSNGTYNNTGIGSPIRARIGEFLWIPFQVCMLPSSLITFEPAVLTDSDTRARATVMNIRSISSGTNVVCLTDLSSFTLDYFSSANLTSTSQKDQVVVRSYYARNSGFTYASGSAVPTDDCVRMEAEIQITDHPLNTDGAVFNVSVGSRVGGVIEIELQKIQVIRVPGKADIVVEMTSLNPNTTVHQPNDQVPIRLLIHHSVNSTEEPTNPIIRVIFPPYMSFDPVTAGVVENSTAYTVVTTKQNTSVDFQFPMLLFVDWIELNFSLVANPTRMETPASVGLGVSAVTLARAVCTNSTAFYHCGDISAASYLISSVGCASGSLGMSSSALIQDCQITASTAATAAFAPQNARPGGSTYWAPALGSVEPYIEIHFGNLTEISAVSVAFAADSASITGFKLMSSFDGVSYSEAASGTTLPFTVPSAFVTRFLRFVITSVSDTTKKLTKIQIDPQGCFRALDVTISDTCPYVPPTRFTDNIKTWRHAVVDATNKIVYFCIYHTIKMRTLCYSGATDGTVWQAAPPYIGYFSGVDKSVKPPRALCVDAKDAAYVYTKDGLFFSPMSKADFDAAVGASATFIAAKVVPSTPAVSVDLFNGWTADNTGIKLMGALKVDWSTCCN